jgi:hypothetical protein
MPECEYQPPTPTSLGEEASCKPNGRTRLLYAMNLLVLDCFYRDPLTLEDMVISE